MLRSDLKGTFFELIQLPKIFFLCVFIHVERMGSAIAICFMLLVSKKSNLGSLRSSSTKVKQKHI